MSNEVLVRILRVDMTDIIEPAVAAIIDDWDADNRKSGLALRTLIFQTAASISQVGVLLETLKWNQPAYLTQETGSGSTIRLGVSRGGNKLALYFHCQTSLVETFRLHYSDRLVFENNRAILLDPAEALPTAALEHCIALALTYHLKSDAPPGIRPNRQ